MSTTDKIGRSSTAFKTNVTLKAPHRRQKLGAGAIKSITNFSILVGSLEAYLSQSRTVGVRSRGCTLKASNNNYDKRQIRPLHLKGQIPLRHAPAGDHGTCFMN